MGCRTEICARSRAPSNQKTHEPPTPGPLEPLRRLCPQVTSAGGPTDRPAAASERAFPRSSIPVRTHALQDPRQTQPRPKPASPAARQLFQSILQRWHPRGQQCRPLQTPCAWAPTGPASLAPCPSSAAPPRELSGCRPRPPRDTPRQPCPLASAGTPRISPGRARYGVLRMYVCALAPPLPFPPRELRVVMETRPVDRH